MEGSTVLYRPGRLSGIIGNKNAVDAIILFAASVEKGVKRKPLMLCGPTGTGKSAAVYALAAERGWHVVELSASEHRDSGMIERVLMPAATNCNVFGRKSLIFLDEVDELASRFDSGAAGAITELIRRSKNPIIFTANSYWDRRISFLREAVDRIEFKRVETQAIAALLKKVAAARSIGATDTALYAVAQRSNGDVRGALNDLFAFAGGGSAEDVLEAIGQRDSKKDIFETLEKIFYANTLKGPLAAAANCNVDKDMLIRWLEENIEKRYLKMDDRSRAFNSLSDATVYSSRAETSQRYGLWRYMNVMLSSGVSLAKTDYPSNAERYSFPKIITDLSKHKGTKEREIEIAEKLQTRMHASVREIRTSILPLVKKIARHAGGEEDTYGFLERAYRLDKKDSDFLVGI